MSARKTIEINQIFETQFGLDILAVPEQECRNRLYIYDVTDEREKVKTIHDNAFDFLDTSIAVAKNTLYSFKAGPVAFQKVEKPLNDQRAIS